MKVPSWNILYMDKELGNNCFAQNGSGIRLIDSVFEEFNSD
jgi:hypothetical protein